MVRFDNSRSSGHSRAAAYCAVLVMLGGLLSACSVWDTGTAALPGSSNTSASPASESADPWTLPVEQRPELFNPCTEISLDDLTAAGLENPTPRPEAEDFSDDPPLRQCGWEADNFLLTVGSIWTAMSELSDGPYERITSVTNIDSYSLGTLEKEGRTRQLSCGVASETALGLITLDAIRVTNSVNSARNDKDTCEDLTVLFGGLASKLPEPRS